MLQKLSDSETQNSKSSGKQCQIVLISVAYIIGGSTASLWCIKSNINITLLARNCFGYKSDAILTGHSLHTTVEVF